MSDINKIGQFVGFTHKKAAGLPSDLPSRSSRQDFENYTDTEE